MKPISRTILGLALCAVVGGCTTAYDSSYYDPYVYYSYYPADVYYGTYYYADPYYYNYLDYGGGGGNTTGGAGGGGNTTGGAGMTATDAGASSNSDATVASGGGVVSGRASQSIGDALRALARGEDICGSGAQVTPRMEANPCPTNGMAMIRSGATVVFAGCQLANGAKLDGTIDVQTSRTVSDPSCGAATMVTIMHTTTITNLAYAGPSGRKLVIPNQTGTGSTIYVNGQKPTTASTSLQGRLQIMEANGGITADRSYTGDITITPAQDGSGSYTIDGMLTLTDANNSGTTMMTATGLMRSTSCCRPTAGRLTVTRSGQMSFGLHTWTFDSSTCGSARFDDKSVSLGACL